MVAILANARVEFASIIQGYTHKNPHGFFEELATRCLQICIHPVQPQVGHLERYSQSSLRHRSLSGLLCHLKRHEILFLPSLLRNFGRGISAVDSDGFLNEFAARLTGY